MVGVVYGGYPSSGTTIPTTIRRTSMTQAVREILISGDLIHSVGQVMDWQVMLIQFDLNVIKLFIKSGFKV